jgi:hypothetical protein
MPDKLTLEQFGQKVKAKYPDYANVPDAELAQRVIAKHPEYADSVQQGASGPHNEFSAVPSAFSIAGLKQAAYNTADRITNALPAIGGVVGGFLGGGGGATAGSIVPGAGTLGGGAAGAIGGAGIGGMLGQAARQPLREAIFP